MAISSDLSLSQVAKILRDNFRLFDNASMNTDNPLGSWDDQTIGLPDLALLYSRSDVSQSVRSAALTVLMNPDMYEQLEHAAGSQRFIQRSDLDALVSEPIDAWTYFQRHSFISADRGLDGLGFYTFTRSSAMSNEFSVGLNLDGKSDDSKRVTFSVTLPDVGTRQVSLDVYQGMSAHEMAEALRQKFYNIAPAGYQVEIDYEGSRAASVMFTAPASMFEGHEENAE